MSWSKEWPSQVWPSDTKSIGDTVWSKTFFENGEVKTKIIPTEEMHTNLKPTHDPYANPNCFLYYECKCGAKLDPHTKRFSELNNAASKEGWKVRWKRDGSGYEPFCVECGEDIE